MSTEAAELTRLLAQHRPKSANHGYPLWLRTRVAEHVITRQAQGTRICALGDELGVSRTTLRKWAHTHAPTSPSGAGFSRVVLTESSPRSSESQPAAPSAPTEPPPVVLTSPQGFSLHGLSPEQALQALMVLR